MLANKALSAAPSAVPLYIEDTFSTYLYTGNGSTQTITNNIDLSGQGGLVWLKNRSVSSSHRLVDTDRGALSSLFSGSTSAASTRTSPNTDVDSFSSTGFVAGNFGSANGNNWCSWTFRKAEKFFDVVTFNADLSKTNQRISHNLGSVPGTIIIKCTNVGGSFSDWWTYHRSLGRSAYLTLNSTTASTSSTNFWGTSDPTSTDFGFNAFDYGLSGGTYVAYLFAHDAGGFGLSGSDNVISCGSYTGNGSATGPTVTLGYEPQWVLVKRASGGTGNWTIVDNMRGFAVTAPNKGLTPNTSDAEYNISSTYPIIQPTATGFRIQDTTNADWNASSSDYIYIAIRRGPMKTPTSGTSVYNAVARTGTGADATVTGVGFAPDLSIVRNRNNYSDSSTFFNDRLRGRLAYIRSASTNAEASNYTTQIQSFDMDGFTLGSDQINGGMNYSSSATYINHFFRRAPGFFDVVCYTGTGSATTFSHNLGVVPELMIVKRRDTANAWAVYANNDNTDYLVLNTTAATVDDNTYWNDTSPTSSVFSVGTNNATNASGSTYVAYLFASLSGVSKIGTYTGNGSSVTVTTNFQPRFILVKRTDSTGDWIVSDSARGLVAGNDPYLELNTTDAEVTNEDWVDISSTSFTVNQTTNNANVNTGTYIYLCIA